MSAEKFKNSKFDEDKIVPPKKDFKSKVNNIVEKTIEEKDVVMQSVGLNLFDMEEHKEATKKSAMTIYFDEADLKLLKAISKLKNTTVNKTVMNILEATINTTKANFPEGFDIDELANGYDEKNKTKGRKPAKKRTRKVKKAENAEQSQPIENE